MENSPLALFKHEKFGSLRVVERKVQPWFVAKDVCDILELGDPSVRISDRNSSI